MNFKNFLQKADLYSFQEFIKYGAEAFIKPEAKPYCERIKEARKNAVDFFERKFSNIDEFDKVLGYFDEQNSVYEEVYFEIGMILGAKMAFEISGKLDELR